MFSVPIPVRSIVRWDFICNYVVASHLIQYNDLNGADEIAQHFVPSIVHTFSTSLPGSLSLCKAGLMPEASHVYRNQVEIRDSTPEESQIWTISIHL